MSALSGGDGVAENSARKLSRGQRRQVGWLTLGAIALYVGFRVLPTGTNLSHGDFRTGANPGSLEMCDPANPQFIPVVAMKSPVSMEITTDDPAPQAGREVRAVVRLLTASGKPVGPVDLLVMHTQKLHLLVIDPTLNDYQHVHPEPGERAGDWTFSFTPQRGGLYRIFADFTPAATGRGLYAGADLQIAPSAEKGSADAVEQEIFGTDAALRNGKVIEVRRDGFLFSLVANEVPLRAGKPADLAFSVTRSDGGEVSLQPVMAAYAHLVAFDEARSGFAHLHPNETDLTQAPDKKTPRLTFKITIPQKGRYVIWAQVKLGGHGEMFVPFPITVE